VHWAGWARGCQASRCTV